MNKAQMVATIRAGDRATIPHAQAEAIVDDLLAGIAQAVVAGTRVILTGVGYLTTHPTKEQPGHNPRTGEAITIPAGRRVKFKTAGALKELLAAEAAQ
jgi:DNA-binding protein HU-beta